MITIITLIINTKGTNYPKTFVVTQVTKEEVICIDFNGDEWAFKNAEDDWLIGDYVSAIMNDNGTESIYDDSFVSVRYSGWLNGFWGYEQNTGNSIIYLK